MIWRNFWTKSLRCFEGNLLIMGTVLYMRDLRRNPTFVMILNLSLSDLTVSVAVDSFTLVGELHEPPRIFELKIQVCFQLKGCLAGQQFFDQYPVLCQFSGAMCLIACGTSLVSMGFLAINR